MENHQYEELVEGLISERNKVLTRLEKTKKRLSEIDADIEALDRVRGLLGGEKAPETPQTFADAKEMAGRNTTLVDAIRKVIEMRPRNRGFTSRDIKASLEDLDPELVASTHKASIPGALSQMAKDNIIALLLQGSGRRPSVYAVRGHDEGHTNE